MHKPVHTVIDGPPTEQVNSKCGTAEHAQPAEKDPVRVSDQQQTILQGRCTRMCTFVHSQARWGSWGGRRQNGLRTSRWFAKTRRAEAAKRLIFPDNLTWRWRLSNNCVRIGRPSFLVKCEDRRLQMKSGLIGEKNSTRTRSSNLPSELANTQDKLWHELSKACPTLVCTCTSYTAELEHLLAHYQRIQLISVNVSHSGNSMCI